MAETVLNTVWVCLGIAAMGAVLSSRAPGRGRRVLCVLLGIIFLFPCVSASDDLLCLANAKPNQCLTQLFTDLQNFQFPAQSLLPPAAPCFLAAAAVSQCLTSEPHLLTLSGRSPPGVPDFS